MHPFQTENHHVEKRVVAATTYSTRIQRATNTCSCIDGTKYSISNPTRCFFRSCIEGWWMLFSQLVDNLWKHESAIV
jgi:hypothetical protein